MIWEKVYCINKIKNRTVVTSNIFKCIKKRLKGNMIKWQKMGISMDERELQTSRCQSLIRGRRVCRHTYKVTQHKGSEVKQGKQGIHPEQWTTHQHLSRLEGHYYRKATWCKMLEPKKNEDGSTWRAVRGGLLEPEQEKRVCVVWGGERKPSIECQSMSR